jgi:hypothetical protein
MKTEVFVFNGQSVSFLQEKEHGLMVNATEMAGIFGKQTSEFLSNKSTHAFIEACIRRGNLCGVETREDLVVSRQRSGTWMHRVLALKFAAWLDPAFELCLYSTIDELLFGRMVRRVKSHERARALQKEMEALAYNPEKSGADFERYLELERQLKQESAQRRASKRDEEFI